MSFYICSNSEDNYVEQAVSLHIRHLSDGGFITKLGNDFLLALYKDWLRLGNAILIFSLEGDKLNGFVLGIKKKDRLFNPIKARPITYLGYLLSAILKKPFLLPKIIESIFYEGKSTTKINAELLVIVTDGENRSRGIGSEMVGLLGKEFLDCGINEYVVTVRKEMERSNNFYVKNKMTLCDSFLFYGKIWNMYKKTITEKC